MGGADGANPSDGLYRDAQGDFYGSTALGGSQNYGTVFEVTGSGQHVILHNFNGFDGAQPIGGVTLDPKGNIFGVTYYGGRHNEGTIFELTANTIPEFRQAKVSATARMVFMMNRAS